MSTSSGAIPEVAATATTQPFLWSVRRELWESRSIYLAPLGVAALFLSGYLVSLVYLPAKLRAASPEQAHQVLEQPYDLVALMVMGVGFIVAVIYCLDALYGERRDRSILFWKSLPVSDMTTVLAKASIPVVAIPVLTLAITMAMHVVMLLLSSAALAGSGMSAGMMGRHLPHMWWMLAVHLLAGHGLWYAPLYAWLLLVSAWARRVPFLWAALPLVAIGFVEKIAFNTAYFARMLEYRMMGGGGTGGGSGSMSMDAMTPYTLGQMLSAPGLWIGLAVAALLLWGAVRLRRERGPN